MSSLSASLRALRRPGRRPRTFRSSVSPVVIRSRPSLAASLARPGGERHGAGEPVGRAHRQAGRAAEGGDSRSLACRSGPDHGASRSSASSLGTSPTSTRPSAGRSANGARAVLVQDDPYAFFGRTQIAELGLKHRLPVGAGTLESAVAGALMAYGPDRLTDAWPSSKRRRGQAKKHS